MRTFATAIPRGGLLSLEATYLVDFPPTVLAIGLPPCFGVTFARPCRIEVFFKPVDWETVVTASATTFGRILQVFSSPLKAGVGHTPQFLECGQTGDAGERFIHI